MGEDALRVVVERSGGVAGRVLRTELDAAGLPPEEARELTELVRRADVAALAARGEDAGSGGPRGADRFQYDVTVEQGGAVHHVRVHDGAVPAELKPLLDHVAASRRRP